MRGHINFLKSGSGSISISILNGMSMKLHSKLGSYLRIKTKVLKELHTVRLQMVPPTPRRIVWRLTLAAARRR